MSSIPDQEQELGSMYDYLAKIILLGPSGAGKWVIQSWLGVAMFADVVLVAEQILCATSVCEE